MVRPPILKAIILTEYRGHQPPSRAFSSELTILSCTLASSRRQDLYQPTGQKVPGVGVEPTRRKPPQGLKPCASADSASRDRTVQPMSRSGSIPTDGGPQITRCILESRRDRGNGVAVVLTGSAECLSAVHCVRYFHVAATRVVPNAVTLRPAKLPSAGRGPGQRNRSAS